MAEPLSPPPAAASLLHRVPPPRGAAAGKGKGLGASSHPTIHAGSTRAGLPAPSRPRFLTALMEITDRADSSSSSGSTVSPAPPGRFSSLLGAAQAAGSAHSSAGPAQGLHLPQQQNDSLPNRSQPRTLLQPRPGKVPAKPPEALQEPSEGPSRVPSAPHRGVSPALPFPAGFSPCPREGYNDVPGTQTKPVGPEAFVECKEALTLPRLGGETRGLGDTPGPCPAQLPSATGDTPAAAGSRQARASV